MSAPADANNESPGGRFYCGHDLESYVPALADALVRDNILSAPACCLGSHCLRALLHDSFQDTAVALGFDFVATPLAHPRFRRDASGVSDARCDAFTRSDLELTSSQWTTMVVGKVSRWLDLDSACERVRVASEAALRQEAAWATHVAVPAVLLPPIPRRHPCVNYARVVNQLVSQAPSGLAVWLEVPLTDPRLGGNGDGNDSIGSISGGGGGGGGSGSSAGSGVGPAARPVLAAPIPDENPVTPARALGGSLVDVEDALRDPRRAAYAAADRARVSAWGDAREIPGGASLQQIQAQQQAEKQSLAAERLRAGGVGRDDGPDDPWEAYNMFRLLCDQHPNVSAALVLTADLPPPAVQRRWLGEPVKAVFVPTSIFLVNRQGYPTLRKAHQRFIQRLFTVPKAQFLVRGRSHMAAPAVRAQGVLPYLQYLRYLGSQVPPLDEKARFEDPYLDFLQAPLQPLMDNLESQTYETFEKDPVKYKRYEEAVRQALVDRQAAHAAARTAAAAEAPAMAPVVIMVVGAGRGPLVNASLQAARAAGVAVRVWAVEKNPNAVVTLRNLKATQWGNAVTIVHQDMREWEAPEKADILVSELLGSWGDNELSPECLDGAQKFLKRPGGISIPYEYTSYAAPITSQKLWNSVKSCNDVKHFETAYVVKLHNICELAEPQPLFRFEHPNWRRDGKPDNRRYATLRWNVAQTAMVHGFSGYFEAMLYKDVSISILPATFSTGMFSWFPMYIPLRHPVRTEKGATVEAHFWRCVSPKKVWYEWCIVQPQPGPVHNPNGRSYWVGL